MTKQEKEVVVIGAGYAGMMTAIRLAGRTRRLKNITITLINANDKFIERPRLHEVATGVDVPQYPIADMLKGTGVNFVKGWVTDIKPGQNSISLQTEAGTEEINYDYLVYGLGSSIHKPIEDIDKYAYVLHPYGDNSAAAMRETLNAYKNRQGRVLVIGGGATGVEGAAHVKSLYPHLDVVLVSRNRFASFRGERIERHIRQGFEAQQIQVIEGSAVVELTENHARLSNGQNIAYDLCLWAGGFIASPLAKDAGLQVNEQNQVIGDPYCRSLDYENIFVVGDALKMQVEPGVAARMSVMMAMVSGAHTADNLNRLFRGRTLKPMSFSYYGQGIAMGINDAAGFGTWRGDKIYSPIFRGRAGVTMRNFFVILLRVFLTAERYIPGAFIWLGKGRYAAQQRRQAGQARATS